MCVCVCVCVCVCECVSVCVSVWAVWITCLHRAVYCLWCVHLSVYNMCQTIVWETLHLAIVQLLAPIILIQKKNVYMRCVSQ